MLCDDRNETINHIICECSKVTQKEYKTRHDRVNKVIHWELCKKLKFGHTRASGSKQNKTKKRREIADL